MGYVSKINKGIDFIESNLMTGFDLAEVSTAAGMSQWHFQRIFSALTGETLKGYIRSRRLSSAMKALLDTDKRIIEIAMSAGYESQESFTRAFQASFGKTPGEFRKNKVPHQFMEKVKIDEDYLRHLSAGLSKDPEIVILPERNFVGLRTLFFGVESEKNNMADKIQKLWVKFSPYFNQVPNQVSGVGYGLIRQMEDSEGQLEYFSAVEVSQKLEEPHDELINIVVPPQKFARFLHKGEIRKLDQSVNYIYSSWLLNSNFLHSSGFDIEEYGPKFHPTSEESEIHYLLPIE